MEIGDKEYNALIQGFVDMMKERTKGSKLPTRSTGAKSSPFDDDYYYKHYYDTTGAGSWVLKERREA